MADTKGYNEIVYQVRTDNTKYLAKTLKPSYVVAFDKVTNVDIQIAKKFNIPIINIDREKYNNYKYSTSEDSVFNNDRYIESYSELKNKRR